LPRRVPALLLASILLVTACTSGDDDAVSTTTTAPATTTLPPTSQTSAASTTTQSPTTSTAAPTTATTIDVGVEPFGTFREVPLLDDSLAYAGPPTPTSLDEVTIFGPVDDVLTPVARDLLAAQGFAVVPGEARLFHHVYGYNEYVPYPVFVTTDSAFHAWHLAFDKVLRDVEEEALLPALERLVGRLVENSRAQRGELAGTELAESADRAAQFYEAAATVLELDVGPIGALATEEVALIMEHLRYTSSPITSFQSCEVSESPANCVDYSLYKPRGHYTRSPDLERYFRAMSVLGQGAFFLDANSLRLGALAARALLQDDAAFADWQRIYEPTAFLVGAADDYTPSELAAAIDGVSPGGLDDPLPLADDELVESVAGQLRNARAVGINPEAASVRIMGVRFTVDSYIIDQLVEPSVANRFVTSVRDVAAAFGSDWAYRSLEADGYTDYARYDEQLSDLRDAVSDRTAQDWGRTVYDSWLYAIEPTWAPNGPAFPDFMQTEAWAAKSHQTGFGSYTELKHDTILYTKQAIAEGGNGEPPPPPRHWVEPDPVVFERLGGAAALLREGLSARDLIDDRNRTTLEAVEDEMAFLARVARAELRSEAPTTEENARLQSFGGWLELIWLNTSDLDRLGEDGGPDEDAALVADIMLSATEGALEVATGRIDRIVVIVPSDAGFQVAMGGTYSFYEFWQDPSNRLTDEEWRALLQSEGAPPRPEWTGVFLAGG
jgi:hypothetical protein